ncbi:MAG TPA: BlaI/MecI/CopY family transcriptional regulator [Bryobacteraceae bacterium]|nr:BlaI/MecI/CopY family transcriptional regulator [Bryobacteraceae bacterium]
MNRIASGRDLPPRLELDCLKVLWKTGEGSVKQVQEALSPSRPLAYTTVMTVLDRLERRGCVQRRKTGRSFVYVALLDEESVKQLAIRELADNLFGGSVASLKLYLSAGEEPKLALAASVDGHTAIRLDASLL